MLAALKIIGLIALGTVAVAYIIVEIAYRMNVKEDKPEPPKHRYRY